MSGSTVAFANSPYLTGPLSSIAVAFDRYRAIFAASWRGVTTWVRLARSSTCLKCNLFSFDVDEISAVSVEFQFDIASDKNSPGTSDLHPRLLTVSIGATYSDEERVDHSLFLSAKRSSGRGRRIQYDSITLEDGIDPFALSLENVDPKTGSDAIEGRAGAKVVGCITQHFFPHDLIIRYDRNLESARRASELIAGRPRSVLRRRAVQLISLSEPVLEILRTALAGITRATEIEQHLFQQLESGTLSIGDFTQRLSTLPPSTRRSVQAAIFPQMQIIEQAFYKQLGPDRTLSRGRVGTLLSAWEKTREFFRFSVRYLGPLRRTQAPVSSSGTSGPYGRWTKGRAHSRCAVS
jgi:hypothetical protein